MTDKTDKTQFTDEQIKKIQDDFVDQFFKDSKGLTREQFIKLTRKHLNKELFNN